MISKWLFSLGVILEASGWSSLWLDLPAGQAFALYTLVHATASGLLCAGVWMLLPARYRSPLPWSPLFLFSLVFLSR